LSPDFRSTRALALRVLALIAVVVLAGCGGEAEQASRVTVDAGVAYQTMEGFGVAQRVFSDPHVANSSRSVVPPAAQRQILAALYRTLGLTRLRGALESGLVEPVNDNTNPLRIAPERFNFAGQGADAHIALVEQARTFGLRTFFPTALLEHWMTNDNPEEAVEWDMAMLLHWRAAGLEPPFYSPLNEPEVSGRSPEWLRQVVVDLGRRMRAAGLKTKLVIPDDVNADAAYHRATAVLDDPEARQYVGALAYHLYGGDAHSFRRMRELAARYGLPIWMTEYSYSHPTFGAPLGSLAWAVKIHELVTQGGVSAVDYIWGFFGDWNRADTYIAIDYENGIYRGYRPTFLYYLTGQWSRFVRPGDRRIRALPSGGTVLTSAFRGRGRVAIVAVNPSDSAQKVTYDLAGGTFGVQATATRTSASERWRELGPISVRNSQLAAELPARSVTTFVVPLQT